MEYPNQGSCVLTVCGWYHLVRLWGWYPFIRGPDLIHYDLTHFSFHCRATWNTICEPGPDHGPLHPCLIEGPGAASTSAKL